MAPEVYSVYIYISKLRLIYIYTHIFKCCASFTSLYCLRQNSKYRVKVCASWKSNMAPQYFTDATVDLYLEKFFKEWKLRLYYGESERRNIWPGMVKRCAWLHNAPLSPCRNDLVNFMKLRLRDGWESQPLTWSKVALHYWWLHCRQYLEEEMCVELRQEGWQEAQHLTLVKCCAPSFSILIASLSQNPDE